MSGLNVTLSDGTKVTIKVGEKLDDIKAKFGSDAENIFEGIDANENGKLEADELNALKTKLTDNNYTVEVAEDGKTPKKAYNDAIQNMGRRYNQDSLKANFKTDEADKWEIKSGHTLWKIAKATLEQEGLPTDARSINDRISQIANLNGLKNVNNVRIGTKLIYKLTEEGVQKVKDADNNSAVAFGGGVNRGANRGAAPVTRNVPASGRETNTVLVDSPTKDKESTITVTPNGLDESWGEGKALGDDKKIDGKTVAEYTKTEGEETQKAFLIHMEDNVYLSAATYEDLLKLVTDYKAKLAKVKSAPANEKDDAKATRQAENLQALKELAEFTNNNVAVLKLIGNKLQDVTLVDRTSDDYKAFVQDLILTRDADVVKGLLYKNNNANSAVLKNDKTAHEYLAGLYQEIRNQEKAGEPPLTDEQIALKEVVAGFKYINGYKIAANTANGVHEKYMLYFNMDGTPMYQIKIGDVWYYAKDEKVLDEFLTKLEAADTDDKKTALFKEYAQKTDLDPELAKCLARNAQTLKAANEDIVALVKAHGAGVIDELNSDITDKTVVDAVVARAKEIYTNDPGNLENAVYLEQVMAWIDKVELTDAEKAAVTKEENETQEQAETKALNNKRVKLKEEIAKTYFEVADDGTVSFEPSRIPTKEEMVGLCEYNTAEMREALVKYTKLEDMGKGRYNEAIENTLGTMKLVTVPHYAEMVDKMESKEDVMDFIDNRVVENKYYHIPFDKIIEKFGDNPEVMNKLLELFDCDDNGTATISDENRVKLIKQYMEVDSNGNYTFKKENLPQGVKIDALINALPSGCSKDEGAKLYDAILNSYTKVPEDGDWSLNKLLRGHYRNVDEAPKNKEKLMSLVDTIVVGSANGNELIDELRWNYDLTEAEKAKLYSKCSDAKKRDMISGGYTKNDALHIVRNGESIDTIVKNYLRKHLDKFPRLKKSVEENPDKWTPERITEALDDYLKDFRKDILSDLGISNPAKLIANKTIIDLDKIKWEERQPGWWNYNFTY